MTQLVCTFHAFIIGRYCLALKFVSGFNVKVLLTHCGLQIKFDEEETSNLRDRLLPIVIGLLRTVSHACFSVYLNLMHYLLFQSGNILLIIFFSHGISI